MSGRARGRRKARRVSAPTIESTDAMSPIRGPAVTQGPVTPPGGNFPPPGYTPYQREYWPGGGVVAVGLSNPSIVENYIGPTTFYNQTAVIENKRFIGGWIVCDQGSRMTFRNCEFVDCEFHQNEPWQGNTMDNWTTIEDCLFRKTTRYLLGSQPDGDSLQALQSSGFVVRRTEFRWVTRIASMLTNAAYTAQFPTNLFDTIWWRTPSGCCEGHQTSFYFYGTSNAIVRNSWIESNTPMSAVVRFYGTDPYPGVTLTNSVWGGVASYCMGLNASQATVTNNYYLTWYPLTEGFGTRDPSMDVPRTHHTGSYYGTYEGGGGSNVSGNKWFNNDGIRVQGGPADLGSPGVFPP